MDIIIYTLIAVFAVSLVSLVGVFFLSMSEKRLSALMHLLVGLAAGALLGDAIVHLIPEAFEAGLGSIAFSVTTLTGVLIFFILEKYLRWHHHEHDTGHTHVPSEAELVATPVKPLGRLVLVGDGVHNAVDGAVIAASFLVSPALGIATTLAVFLHEVPQEIADFALLLHAGFSRAKALMWNFISALTAFLGAFAFFAVGSSVNNVEPYAAAFTAGAFIYIAAADLIPELHEEKHPRESAMQLVAMLVGIAIMFALLVLE